MFKAMHLGNFKAFKESQRIPIRPLTLVFGPNSAGKSSLLHGLLFAHDATSSDRPDSLDVKLPRISGDCVDLGGFRQFVHGHDLGRAVEWGAEVDTAMLTGSLANLVAPAATVQVSVQIKWYRATVGGEKAYPTIKMSELAQQIGVSTEELFDRCTTITLMPAAKEQLLNEAFRLMTPYELTACCGDQAKIQELIEAKKKEVEAKHKDRPLLEYLGVTPDSFVDGSVQREIRKALGLPIEPSEFIPMKPVINPDGLIVQGPRIESFQITGDGRTLLTARLRGSGLDWNMSLDELDTDHVVLRQIVETMVAVRTKTQSPTADDLAVARKAIDELVPSLVLEQGGFLPTGARNAAAAEGEAEETGPVPAGKGKHQNDIERVVQRFFPSALDALIGGLASLVAGELKRLRYLGPLRSYPARHFAFTDDHDANWQAGGGHAWDVVRQDKGVRDKVNAWFGSADRMKTPYELVVRQLYDLENLKEWYEDTVRKIRQTERILTVEETLAEDAKNLLSDDSSFPWALNDEDRKLVESDEWESNGRTDFARFRDKVLPEGGQVNELSLIDKRTNTKVSHRDVGAGISQILPVLVSAFAAQNETLAMEQPEAQLHPALQAELGDVLIESALQRNNTFIIETHSEHVLLRVMKRMRQTVDGSLPNGISPVRPDDVMVLYVEPDKARSIVREMPLNDRGELIKAWPGGFFEEGLREVF